MAKITRLSDDALIVLDNLSDTASHMFEPTLRFGVTGLSRAGKTVFITSLIHNLLNGGRLPLFSAQADGRIEDARLSPQPDDAVPRFKYEQHLEALLNERVWPNSTSSISQIRLRIAYQSASGWTRTFGAGELTLDIIDYPGEWLLDLPLLGKSFAEWSAEALQLSRLPARESLATDWHAALGDIRPGMPESDVAAENLAATFTNYLRACREDESALSPLPPGRFLMPGDLEGSPALTFSPLDLPSDAKAEDGTFHAMMERRYPPLLPRAFRTVGPANRSCRCAAGAQCRSLRSCRSAKRHFRHSGMLQPGQALVADATLQHAHRPHLVCSHES